MDILNEIYQTIDNIVQRRMEQSGLNNQVQAIVLGSSANGKYTISVNGAKYSVRDGVGINPKPNTPVWVCIPNNDWNKAYICAGKGTANGGTGNINDVYQNGVSVLGEDHIARINCATPEDIQQLQVNFQAGVDAVYDAVDAKGTTPDSHSLSDVVTAIGEIQTGGNYMTKEIREDGTYYASDDGVDAYDVVVVSKDVGQMHTVVFYDVDGTTILKTQANVPYHGYASCTALDGTIVNGQYFKGWNPSPSNIVRDTFCYPEFGDYIIQSGEIEDDWETICAKRGADYPLCSYKPLVVTIPPYSFDFDFTLWNGSEWINKTSETINAGAVNIALHMYKVAEGEDNSTSTWISSKAIYISGNILASGKWTGAFGIYDTDGDQHTSDWGNSAIRRYLNSHFLDNLPMSLKNAIVQVNKAYIGFTNVPHTTSVYPSQINKESLDKIWMLSKKELYTKVKNYPNITWYGGYELNGIDYSSIYMPTLSTYGYTANSCLRTSCSYNYEGENYAIMDSMGDPLNGSANMGDSSAAGYMLFGFCL